MRDDEQYKRYRLLKEAWTEDPAVYERLSAKAQWAVHLYYQPSEKLSFTEHSEHRRRVTRERPWLPSLAGKAYKAIAEGYRRKPKKNTKRSAAKTVREKRGGRSRHISVRGIRREPPDLEKLYAALIELAHAQQESRSTASTEEE